MAPLDFYSILGVPRSADDGELRAAYVRLVKRHHPDWEGRGVIPLRLQQLQDAYRCLRDPTRRAEHDDMLRARDVAHFRQVRRVERATRRYDRRQKQGPKRRRGGLLVRLMLAPPVLTYRVLRIVVISLLPPISRRNR